MEAMKALGAAIAARRKLFNLTQRELADLAGCSEVFIVRVEQGKPTVRFDKLLDVLRTLGLELVLQNGQRGVAVDPTP